MLMCKINKIMNLIVVHELRQSACKIPFSSSCETTLTLQYRIHTLALLIFEFKVNDNLLLCVLKHSNIEVSKLEQLI